MMYIGVTCEKEILIKDWEPAPLIDEKQRRETVEANLGYEDGAPMLVIHSSAGPYVSLQEDGPLEYLNLVTTGYLNYQDDKEIVKVAEKSLRVNGVGACGPRGFYGTVDVHLDLEKRMAKYFGTPQAVLYSSGFATISSVIPAFSKSNDYLFVDRGVSFATQTGVTLARSKTFWFSHNNMEELEALCQQHEHVFKECNHRVFVVIEGLYLNHGDIAPLDKILALKQRFPFRILCEESHSVGVLGKTGRGITEHFGVPVSSVEIISGSTGHALGGIGGFSVGPKEATVHQRLSSSGYVFSCSLPPFVAAATIVAFDRLETGVELKRLQERAKDLHSAFTTHIRSLVVVGMDISPVLHLRLPRSTGTRFNDEKLLQTIVDQVRVEHKVILTRSQYVFSESNPPPASIRVVISSKHEAKDLIRAAKAIEAVAHPLVAGLQLKDAVDEDDEEEIIVGKAPLGSPKSGRKITSPSKSRKAVSSSSQTVTSPSKSKSKSKKNK